uniref:uncharacterized protein LOC122767933 isoform X2 n=1 Tax=Solea senegalensis TaxID=28829 RepID=UPI001CD90826|nr:uncharacterized protein LOC122767933 isoform X2 [Solea senegalensis]
MSKRRPRLTPQAEATQFILSGHDKTCLKVQWINVFKGRGVFACAPIEKGSFVVEYRGEFISKYERDKRQKKYTEKQNAFLFDVDWNSDIWCIDASREDGSLGRLVNDDHKSPNCKIKKMTVQGKPHLCLFAIQNIQAETEITYDYGKSQWPWRALTSSDEIGTNSADPEVSERSTASCEQTSSDEIGTNSADPEVSERSTASCEQTSSDEIGTNSADPEVSERSTASCEQTSSDEIGTNSADPEVSERSTASCEQISSVEIGTNSADPEVSERSTASCEQVEHPSVHDERLHVGDSSSCSDQISDHDSSDHSDYEDIDYVPQSPGSSSDTSLCSRELRISENPLEKVFRDTFLGIASTHSGEIAGSEKPRSFSSSPISNSHSSSVRRCSADSSEKTPNNDSAIKVSPFQKSGQKSKYNKKQYCFYCKKPISKLARHLESVHSNQPDVAKALSFNKKSRKRRELFRCLKKRGNFDHNATVASDGAGEWVPCRRPSSAKRSDHFSHCKYCQGLYARDCLWRHVRRCPQRSVEEFPTGQKRIRIDLPKPHEIHEAVWKIACEMNQDEISLVVRSEREILRLGESLYNARKPHERRNDYIRQKMREMARLLITARATTPLKCTEDLVMPSNFRHVIQAVRAVAGYELDSNSYKIPSLALKLGHSLAKVAGIVQCNAIIENRHEVAELAKQFATLYEKKWTESISGAALGTLQQAKWNKPLVLPFTQDVTLMHRFLAIECAKCMKDVEERPDSTSFGNLAKVTLTQVVLFNRKRQGEVSKMELQTFTSRNRTELNPDIMMGLTELEKNLAKHFDRVEIRGKRSRMVPVLLTPDMVAAMDLLIKNRIECQVHTENVYLFARPGVLSHYRGSDCLRTYANQCGAKNPEALTSTRLRKQVATLSTVLNLKENEMDQLATFLGHDIRVHREFYRLPESTLQLAKISKLLIAMEKGKLSDLQGKGLDDIEINPEDEVAMSDDDSSEETSSHLDQHIGSRTETTRDPTHAPDSTTVNNMEDTSDTAILDNMEDTFDSTAPAAQKHQLKTISNVQPINDHQQDTILGTAQVSLKSSNKKQAEKVRSKWTGDEVQAVERHMIRFITSCKVPGKRDCDACLQAESEALKDRDWSAIKYYIHNRITALKRKMNR